jgi:hypothetical protein
MDEFWAWVGEKLGIRDLSPEQISNLTFEQAVKGAVADITSGQKIGGETLANQSDYDFDVTGITEANAREMQGIKEAAVANGTFMKAPNGKPTNLNERGWLQVRTEAFKKWFGDWELRHKVINIVKAAIAPFENRTVAREWAKKNIAGVYTNEQTGGKGEIHISNSAIDKYTDDTALAKSENKDVHYSVLRVLPRVIKESVVGETHESYNKKDGERSPKNGVIKDETVHRLYGAVEIDGNIYRVKTTLIEYKGSQANNPHSYEVTKIELLEGKPVSRNNASNTAQSSNSISAAKLLNNIEKTYEKGKFILDDHSKVVDSNGEPQVVYHGSKVKFNTFDRKKVGTGDWGFFGEGFYFSESKNTAFVYSDLNSGKIFETFLNIKEPLEIAKLKSKQQLANYLNIDVERIVDNGYSEGDEEFEARFNNKDINDTTSHIAEKHDGVFVERTYNNGSKMKSEIVVFSPSQIKSATDNNGNFDEENDDIRHMFAGEKGAANLDKAEEATTAEGKEKNAIFAESIINEKGEVNYEELGRTTTAVEEGGADINRLSLGEEQGRREGGRRNVEASLLLGANQSAGRKKSQDERIGSTGDTWGRVGRYSGEGVSTNTVSAHQEGILKEYAQHEGIWITPEEVEKWEYMDTGMEARVYKDPNNPDCVLKVVYNYKNFSETPQEYLDNRISLHNFLFGDTNTGYELVGFTETYGATVGVGGKFFATVLRQRRILGREIEEDELPCV